MTPGHIRSASLTAGAGLACARERGAGRCGQHADHAARVGAGNYREVGCFAERVVEEDHRRPTEHCQKELSFEVARTASLPQSHHDYTFGDYLALERESEIKHELDGGEILAMPGGTARHSALAAKIVIALGTTRGPGCTVFQSDMRVRVVATGRATYPDASMVCGPLEYDPDDAAHTTITNPSLIIEVLSVTTEKGDRGNKWMHYQRIPSLQEYVLVSQDFRIEIFRRMPSGTWEYVEVREGTVKLASGPTLDLSTLYADLPL